MCGQEIEEGVKKERGTVTLDNESYGQQREQRITAALLLQGRVIVLWTNRWEFTPKIGSYYYFCLVLCLWVYYYLYIFMYIIIRGDQDINLD